MLEPSTNQLVNKVGSKYTLVVLVAKRAREIEANSEPLVDTDSIKPVSIAIKEVFEDKITYEEI